MTEFIYGATIAMFLMFIMDNLKRDEEDEEITLSEAEEDEYEEAWAESCHETLQNK